MEPFSQAYCLVIMFSHLTLQDKETDNILNPSCDAGYNTSFTYVFIWFNVRGVSCYDLAQRQWKVAAAFHQCYVIWGNRLVLSQFGTTGAPNNSFLVKFMNHFIYCVELPFDPGDHRLLLVLLAICGASVGYIHHILVGADILSDEPYSTIEKHYTCWQNPVPNWTLTNWHMFEINSNNNVVPAVSDENNRTPRRFTVVNYTLLLPHSTGAHGRIILHTQHLGHPARMDYSTYIYAQHVSILVHASH